MNATDEKSVSRSTSSKSDNAAVEYEILKGLCEVILWQPHGPERNLSTTNFSRSRSRTPSHCKIKLMWPKFVAMISRLWKACKRRLRTGVGIESGCLGLAFFPLDLLKTHRALRDRGRHDLARLGISGADRIPTTFAGPSIFRREGNPC